MYCNICGNRGDNINLFMITMCKDCFNEFANISVLDEEYDKYKNLIRILLSYYISPKAILNPAKWAGLLFCLNLTKNPYLISYKKSDE